MGAFGGIVKEDERGAFGSTVREDERGFAQ